MGCWKCHVPHRTGSKGHKIWSVNCWACSMATRTCSMGHTTCWIGRRLVSVDHRICSMDNRTCWVVHRAWSTAHCTSCVAHRPCSMANRTCTRIFHCQCSQGTCRLPRPPALAQASHILICAASLMLQRGGNMKLYTACFMAHRAGSTSHGWCSVRYITSSMDDINMFYGL